MCIKYLLKNYLNKIPKYLLSTSDDETFCEEFLFQHLEDAKSAYEKYDVVELSDYEDSYWKKNKIGQLAELIVLEELPTNYIPDFNNHTDDEMLKEDFVQTDSYHQWGRRIETKFAYFNEDLTEIRMTVVAGKVYETSADKKIPMTNINELIQ